MKHLSHLLIILVVSITPISVLADSQTIEVAFSPKQGATKAIVRLISEAQKTIRIAAYSFTSKDIAVALMAAHKRGVDVKAVLDKSNLKTKYTSATFLANIGIQIRIDSKYSIMHSKYMIVDGVTVETGSFNYTKAAEQRNAENIIILRNQPKIAQQYEENWQKLWDESEAYKAHY